MTRIWKSSIVLSVLLSVGCAPNTATIADRNEGYCLEAEGLRQAKCYTNMARCQRSESILSNQHPYAAIESECHYQKRGRLPVEGLASAASN